MMAHARSQAAGTNVWVYMLRNTEVLGLSPLAAHMMQPHRMPESRNHVGGFVLRRDIPRLCHETQHRMWVEPANGVRWRLVAFGTIGATQCLMIVGSRCWRLLADRRIASTQCVVSSESFAASILDIRKP